MRHKLPVLLLLGLLAGCTSTTAHVIMPTQSAPSAPPPVTITVTAPPSWPAAAAPPLVAVHNPGQVTGTLTGKHCQLRGGPPLVLPDPNCTPGGYDPAITATTIATTLCVPKPGGHGSTAYVQSAAWVAGRPPSSQTTKAELTQIDPAYALPPGIPGEVDHLVPRELGGSNDLSNLWLEPGPIPNQKDTTAEDKLHDWMCAAITPAGRYDRLQSAQQAIAADWITAPQVLGITAP